MEEWDSRLFPYDSHSIYFQHSYFKADMPLEGETKKKEESESESESEDDTNDEV